jgi:hypothetical protein
MATIAKKHTDKVSDFIKKVDDWSDYFKKNNDQFHRTRKFIYETTNTREDTAVAEDQERPILDVNIVLPYVSRNLGEFSKQVPDMEVRGIGEDADPEQVDLVEGIMRSIAIGSEGDTLSYDIYKEAITGGFSVMEVVTEYENEMSFDQVIILKKPSNPTLCGFDPLAQRTDKSDGSFCFKLTPKTEDEFKESYPNIDLREVNYTRKSSAKGINWFYQQNDKKVIYICDYYYKKVIKRPLLLVSNPENGMKPLSMTPQEYNQLIENWDDQTLAQKPTIIKRRKRDDYEIWRYRFIGNNTIIEDPIKTEYTHLPMIFVSGESVKIDNRGEKEEVCRPYVTSAVDAQRSKNFFLSSLVNETESMRACDILAPKESIPAEDLYSEAWKNPQKATGALIYNHVAPNDPEGKRGPLPPPQIIPRGQISTTVLQMYEMMDRTMQGTLGAFDTQLGVNQKQLSGVAIVEGATQSNAASMPYIVNYLKALQQACNIIIDLIPKYYTTMRTVPVIDRQGKHSYKTINQTPDTQLKYTKNTLDVIIKPGVNFEIQKNRALEKMIQLSQALPAFGQIVNSNLPMVIDNLDIRGKDQLRKDAEEQQQQQKQMQAQQAQQPNPEVMQMQLQQQRLQLQAQQQQQDYQIEQAKLQQQQVQQNIQMIEAQLAAASKEKAADAEIARANAELDIKRVDTYLKHQPM